MNIAIKPIRIDHLLPLVLAFSGTITAPSRAQESTLEDAAIKEVVERPARRFAMIVVGLPGDEEHRDSYREITATWRRWLSEVADVSSEHIMVLSACDAPEKSKTPTAAAIRDEISRLEREVNHEDGLWVFLLGHGSQEGRQGFFHLPGPDMDGSEWAALFSDLDAREQVFWLTQAASGSFLRDLSQPGRIVVTATDADGEQNETRFPRALTTEMELQLGHAPAEPSVDQANEATVKTPRDVLGLFRAVDQRVFEQFDEAKLVPTEHAQLDDNGDGRGTESTDMTSEPVEVVAGSSSPIDGGLAGNVLIELQEAETESPADNTATIDPNNEPEPAATDDQQ